MLSSPSLGWKRSRSFDPFGWLLVKNIACSAMGWHQGLGLTWCCRAGASAGARGGAGVVSQPLSCRALPLPSLLLQTEAPWISHPGGGLLGLGGAMAPGSPTAPGAQPREQRGQVVRTGTCSFCISSPPCSDKYPFPHPKTCFCCFSKCFFFLWPL